MRLPSIKKQLIIFLIGFAIFLSIKDKDALFLQAAFTAIISAVSLETLILYLENRKLTITESSLISGLIIGCVLSADNAWWKIISASLFAIGAKYLIHTRISKKHIFNPAAFGIFLVTVLFGATTSWKGTYLWQILVPFGIYFIYRVRKQEILIGYCLVAFGLFAIQALLQKVSLLNILGYFSYFYIFIMLIEPKTTPIRPFGKMIFGALAAGLIFALTEIGVNFDAELASLLILNSCVPVLDKIPERRPI